MLGNEKIKDFIDIMEEIDHQIVTNPKARGDYIKFLDQEIDKINAELALRDIEPKRLDKIELAARMGVKELEFDNNGRLIKINGQCKARDLRK